MRVLLSALAFLASLFCLGEVVLALLVEYTAYKHGSIRGIPYHFGLFAQPIVTFSRRSLRIWLGRIQTQGSPR